MFDPKDLGSSAPGELVAIQGGHFAFVPRPLPPPLTYDGAVVQSLEAATMALGQLSGIGHTLPNPHMMIRAFQQREALLSSRIEGTVADQQELLFAEVDKTKPLAENVREVRN
jgi:hypothetical protein